MKRILIVDDNAASLNQIQALLGDSFQVSFAKSGEQALNICTKINPDLILMDIRMPQMDGFETLARLRKMRNIAKTPVIFLTASSDIETEVKCLEAGAADFIAKPCDRAVLKHRIDLQLRLSGYQSYLEKSLKELEDSIISIFSNMIEFRDESTGGHVQRTAKYVGLLAEELLRKKDFEGELSVAEVETMERAAPLHDVGKIGISDVILLKPAMLNDEEFNIMKSHTVIGAQLLRNMRASTATQHYIDCAIKIAESHHERFDGKGYPQGLTGSQIPIPARIMAVADVYDALVDTRVYRKSMTHDDARRIILSGSGTQFDPVVVKAFETLEHTFYDIVKKIC
jgi:putative two-component system response regulator